MRAMLPGMLSIAAAWVLLHLVCTGVGLFCTRLICRREWSVETILVSFWLGWCAIVALLQIWQMFAPVNRAALAVMTVLGAVGLVFNWRTLLGTLRRAVRESNRLGLALAAALVGGLGVFGLWLANRSMGPVTPYDAGLYHLTSIRWLAEYPVVPGLGNLQHRLSNISSYFLFHCLVDGVPFVYRSYNIVSGLLLMAAMSQVLLSAWSLLVGEMRTWHVLRALFLAPILRMCFFSAASTSPDVPVFLLGAVLAVETAKVLDEPATGRGRTVRVVLVSCVGVTVKLSLAFLGALASLTVLGAQLLLARREAGPRMARLLAAPAGVAALVLLPYAARNVITSGYPAYHSTLLGLDVPWRVSEGVARHEALLVKVWAIRPGTPPEELFANSEWVLPWLKETLGYYRLEMTIPLLLAVSAVAMAALRRVVKGAGPCCSRWLWLLLPPACSLACWFFAAPAPRFAGAAFWWLGGGAVLLCSHAWRLSTSRTLGVAVLCVSSVLALGFHFRLEKFVDPGPTRGFHPTREVSMKTFVTDSGLSLLCPEEGDQCWDAALPCTPYPNPAMRLRKERDLRSGFVIEHRGD